MQLAERVRQAREAVTKALCDRLRVTRWRRSLMRAGSDDRWFLLNESSRRLAILEMVRTVIGRRTHMFMLPRSSSTTVVCCSSMRVCKRGRTCTALLGRMPLAS